MIHSKHKLSLSKKNDTLHIYVFIIPPVIFELQRRTLPQIHPLKILLLPFFIIFGVRNGIF